MDRLNTLFFDVSLVEIVRPAKNRGGFRTCQFSVVERHTTVGDLSVDNG